MADEELKENYVQSDNKGYITETALSLRLDVTALLQDIEIYLRGSLRSTNEEGKTIETTIGVPLANDEGVQHLMCTLKNYIGPHLVQGYFAEKNSRSEEYVRIINNINYEIMEMIIVNRMEWGIKERDAKSIIDTIVTEVEIFLTRPIGNRERDSYGHSLKHIETTNLKEKSGGMFSFFGKK